MRLPPLVHTRSWAPALPEGAASQTLCWTACSAARQHPALAMGDFSTANSRKDRNKLHSAVKRALAAKHTLTDAQLDQTTASILANKSQKDEVFEAMVKGRPDIVDNTIRHFYKVARTSENSKEQQARKEVKG